MEAQEAIDKINAEINATIEREILRIKNEVRINSYFKVNSTDKSFGLEQRKFEKLVLKIVEDGEFISTQEMGKSIWVITKNPNFELNKSAKLNNKWTPILAGVTALITFTSLVNQSQQSAHNEIQQQLLLKLLTIQDSILKIHQKQIDSLSKVKTLNFSNNIKVSSK